MAVFTRKDDYGYIRWAADVKRRDHYTCVVCGRRGVALNSHHLNAWASHPTERYDVGNGVCLCQSCHDRFHVIYSKGKNTKEQFEEYRAIVETMIKVANEESLLDATAKKMYQQVQKDYAVSEIIKDLEDKYCNETEESESGEVDTSSDTSI